MSDEIRLDGIAVAPGVLDQIVLIAAQGIEGVAQVGAPGLAGLAQKARKGVARAVSVCISADEKVSCSVHIQVTYGHRLREVASNVQTAVADAIRSQVGVQVEDVDVYVDGIVFAE